jgi:hypothetical protein
VTAFLPISAEQRARWGQPRPEPVTLAPVGRPAELRVTRVFAGTRLRVHPPWSTGTAARPGRVEIAW